MTRQALFALAVFISLSAFQSNSAYCDAAPLAVQLKNDVPDGQKPSLTVVATERVNNVRVQLARDDGKDVALGESVLAKGKKAAFALDGAPGKHHYKGTISCERLDGGTYSYDVEFDTLVRAAMHVTADYDHLDLAKHTMQFQLTRPAQKAEVIVTGTDGKELGSGEATYHGEAPGTWLPLHWEQDKGEVMMLHLKVTSTEGLAVAAELIPWSVDIEHDDVNFATGSAAIAPSEAGKLDASLGKIQEAARKASGFVKVKLYVAGHTDTVGGKDHNRELSLQRARSIAEYFRAHGLRIAIAYDGFGEDALKVKTPDETDEPRNRRAEYVIAGADVPPPRSLPRSGSWHALP